MRQRITRILIIPRARKRARMEAIIGEGTPERILCGVVLILAALALPASAETLQSTLATAARVAWRESDEIPSCKPVALSIIRQMRAAGYEDAALVYLMDWRDLKRGDTLRTAISHAAACVGMWCADNGAIGRRIGSPWRRDRAIDAQFVEVCASDRRPMCVEGAM